MLSYVILLLTALPILSAAASESEKEVSNWLHQNQCQMNPYLEEAYELKNSAESYVQSFLTNKEQSITCSKVENEELKEDKKKLDKPILVFVSLSMPKESLKNLYKEAEQNNLVLIIRGLKNNSFKETAVILRELGVSLQIEPTLFDKYEIKEVPTFVSLIGKELLKIKGNISLAYAIKKFEEEQ